MQIYSKNRELVDTCALNIGIHHNTLSHKYPVQNFYLSDTSEIIIFSKLPSLRWKDQQVLIVWTPGIMAQPVFRKSLSSNKTLRTMKLNSSDEYPIHRYEGPVNARLFNTNIWQRPKKRERRKWNQDSDKQYTCLCSDLAPFSHCLNLKLSSSPYCIFRQFPLIFLCLGFIFFN